MSLLKHTWALLLQYRIWPVQVKTRNLSLLNFARFDSLAQTMTQQDAVAWPLMPTKHGFIL